MKNVIIIGSGPAGVSAALYLQRSGRIRTTVISNGAGALGKAEMIGNYYGLAKPVTGRELYDNGINSAKSIGVEFINGEVVSLSFDAEMRPVVITTDKEYIADEMYDSLEEWFGEPITRAEFMDRLTSPCVSFDQDGSLSFSYESGELFCYHAIIVSIEPDDSFSSADLAG